MGKRELLLVGVFVIIGLVAWRLTAPEAKPGEEGFSLGRLVRHIQSEVRGHRASADVKTTAGTRPTDRVTLVELREFSGKIDVNGEDRTDVVAELAGTLQGPDEAQTKARAAAITPSLVARDDRLVLGFRNLDPAWRKRLEVRLRVPRRLGVVLIDCRGDVEIRGVASVDSDTHAGTLVVRDVAGIVTGKHRGGDVEITRVGAVKYDVRRSDARVEQVAGALEYEAEDGRLEVRDVGGTSTLKLRRLDSNLERLAGEVRIDGRDGAVSLRDQRVPVTFEGERTTLSVALSAPAAVRATAREDRVEITLADRMGAELDLEAEHGEIRVPDEAPKIQQSETRQWVKGRIADGGPLLEVRVERGDIVIRR